jgi:transposase
MAIVTAEIELAKNVFTVHGVDATCKPVLLRPSVPRTKLTGLIAWLSRCLMAPSFADR